MNESHRGRGGELWGGMDECRWLRSGVGNGRGVWQSCKYLRPG